MPAETRGCVICGGRHLVRRWPVDLAGSETGVDGRSFRPSSEHFGATSGTVVRCSSCGHGSLAEPPSSALVSAAYASARDEDTLRERTGQLATAVRGLTRVEALVEPGRLLDVGCWTGSFVEAAQGRGWQAEGIEPSAWAVANAVERGLPVRRGDLDSLPDVPGSMRAITLCDVLEHLEDVDGALAKLVRLLEPGGVLYLTVPDAGSGVARTMGRRWWSVLPMHVHYFTRTSMLHLLGRHGLEPAHVGTHAKTFSTRYHAERIRGYSPWMGRVAVTALDRLTQADRLVAPNFRDRMEVLAVRR